jgi:hypothetical protein
MRAAVTLVVAAAVGACGNDHAIDTGSDAAVEADPLTVTDTPAPGSLDDLHARIIVKRCSGQPGLCHNGQFEPNLSTPAMTYAYLVNRPALEKTTLLRVKPGAAAASLLVDKLRNRNGVATQMPLGAEPLAEADIAAIEAWIDAGALRAPGATPAPLLNNPPKRPQIAVYTTGGTRLDGAAPVSVPPGTTLVLRHTVQDFETPDAMIPFAAVSLQAADGRNLVLEPTNPTDPATGPTTYDAAGPMGIGDRLDFKRNVTFGATLTLWDRATNTQATVTASGQTFTLFAVYLDSTTQGIVAFDVAPFTIHIQ